jgi:hypothetical protein
LRRGACVKSLLASNHLFGWVSLYIILFSDQPSIRTVSQPVESNERSMLPLSVDLEGQAGFAVIMTR